MDKASGISEITEVVTGLRSVPLERLESEITELAAHLNAAECRWLLLVAEFDRREGWATWECRSCASWLNWKCGIDLGAARERVRVARRLGELPSITAAFGAGQLSYSKVRALTRVATTDNEEALLEMARAGTASHLERIVRAYRAALGREDLDQANHVHEQRFVEWHCDDDGALVVRARLSAEQGALVHKALELAARAEEGVSAETSERLSTTQRRADALALVAESFVAHGPAGLRGGDRHLVTVHVDAGVLGRRGPRALRVGRRALAGGRDRPTPQLRRLSGRHPRGRPREPARRGAQDAIVPSGHPPGHRVA